MSCKFDLFDVLDADLSGELEFEDLGDCREIDIQASQADFDIHAGIW